MTTLVTEARRGGVALGMVAVAALLGLLVADPLTIRLALVGAALLAAVAVAGREPRVLLYGALAWLTILGLVRRLVTAGFTETASDPLLLVVPAAVGLLLLVAAGRGAFRDRGMLANGVLVLSLFALLGAANPLQGGPAVGAAGLLFVLFPMLWFWIARGLVDDGTFRAVLGFAAAASVAVALYGLTQTRWGFTSWDQRWIDQQGYDALLVEGTVRPFASFSSAAEYAAYLGIGLLVWYSFSTAGRWSVWAVAAIAILGTALFLESSRGAIVVAVVGVGIVAAARRRVNMVAAALAAVIALFALSAVASYFVKADYTSEQTGSLVRHQLEGLADPFDPRRSTLAIHWNLLGEGFSSLWHAPAGVGTGAVTIAGAKFGGTTAGTEVDPSNAAVALGLPGLLAYLVVAVAGTTKVYRLARARRDPLAYAALGILCITGLQWLNGGSYATVVFPWIVLGWADRQRPADD